MGTRNVRTASGSEEDRLATQRVIRDLDALEAMIEGGVFETEPRRVGVEQEMALVDRSGRPAPRATELIEAIGDPRVVPEIALFNLEFNCDPVELGPACLREMDASVRELHGKIQAAGEKIGVSALLTGICPTVELSHLTRENTTPDVRYFALDEGLKRLRGGDYELRIDGADELIVRHPNVMLESVNTSFQVHYQTTPERFAEEYNVAMAVAAPVLAAAVNSPILFGKRLWRETRVAIFQQVVDTRAHGAGARDMRGRVRFGEGWVESSVLEVLRGDVSRFRQVLFSTDVDGEDPVEVVRGGGVPELAAWQAFNSSVYRWMRPCFGVSKGRPHLRIENRVLPSGPTIDDEIANAAFWIGLMVEGPDAWPGLSHRLEFKDARENFLRAARDGLPGHMVWLSGEDMPMQELVLGEFLPVAERGLEKAGVDQGDIDRCLGIVRERAETRRTGARWLIDSAAKLRGQGVQSQRLSRLSLELLERQSGHGPVHTWSPCDARTDECGSLFATVSQCMTTDLFTVTPAECIDLVASIMDWERLRHIPVENEKHELVGLISYRMVLRVLAKRGPQERDHPISAAEIMIEDPVTTTPDMSTLEAIELMCLHRVSCLPVVEDGRLVGIVSERDYTEIARQLLERELRGADAGDGGR